MRVVVGRIFVIGTMALAFGLGSGCQPDEMEPYYHAAEIRRDARILLTTRPASQAEPSIAAADGR